MEERVQFFRDMAILGDALLDVTGAYRINYEILGNTDAALHAHVFPRYLTEPEDKRNGPVWLYEREYRRSVVFNAQRDADLKSQIAEAIQKHFVEVGKMP
jgi:diadenosine tetraphosphate (Ap4A) HIT family hydrolase